MMAEARSFIFVSGYKQENFSGYKQENFFLTIANKLEMNCRYCMSSARVAFTVAMLFLLLSGERIIILN